jgi:hypothetical protein
MGIDIYARWRNMTDEEKNAQYTGFSITAGNVGYLREAYHGDPYATKYLCAEAFSNKAMEDEGVAIESATLKARLPRTLELVRERMTKVYECKDEDEIAEVQKSYTDFVDLIIRKETETGKPVRITASW